MVLSPYILYIQLLYPYKYITWYVGYTELLITHIQCSIGITGYIFLPECTMSSSILVTYILQARDITKINLVILIIYPLYTYYIYLFQSIQYVEAFGYNHGLAGLVGICNAYMYFYTMQQKHVACSHHPYALVNNYILKYIRAILLCLLGYINSQWP